MSARTTSPQPAAVDGVSEVHSSTPPYKAQSLTAYNVWPTHTTELTHDEALALISFFSQEDDDDR